MYKILSINFPGVEIHSRYFERDSFSSKKRHMEIMKIWKDDITNHLDFVFHTEDDWLFTKEFEISSAIDLLKNNTDIAQVGFSQVLRNPPDEFGKVTIKNNFWEWIYKPDLPNQHHLFMDYDEMSLSEVEGYWCYFINWPHFGFRPSVIDVLKISTLESFSDSGDSFELDFANRYSKKFKSYFTTERICKHIGDVSSYEINESKR
jgi:hypothetical protein